MIDGREGYASCAALQGTVRYRPLASRRCSATFDRSAHSRGVGCSTQSDRPPPRFAHSPRMPARRGYSWGWKRMNGIFYLVGLIVVAIIVVYALGHW
jgi:hypothetical protein